MVQSAAPAASSSSAEATTQQPTCYDLSDPRSLIRYLIDADVRLVRLEYLLELRESGRVLPRRQEAEKERTACGAPALVDREKLKELNINEETGHLSMLLRDPMPRSASVHIVSISHVWESMQHPDPWRFAFVEGSSLEGIPPT